METENGAKKRVPHDLVGFIVEQRAFQVSIGLLQSPEKSARARSEVWKVKPQARVHQNVSRTEAASSPEVRLQIIEDRNGRDRKSVV